jgi:signal transduction histidine kinase
MTMQKSRFFFATHPLRALLEALGIDSVVLALLVMVNKQHFGPANQPVPLLFIAFTFLGTPFCMLWLAMRLRRSSRPRWQRYPILLLLAVALSLILNSLGQVASTLWFQNGVEWKTTYGGVHWIILSLLFDIAVFTICRVGVLMWMFWDRLRRTQLVWSLAHSIVILLALVAGAIILLIDAGFLYNALVLDNMAAINVLPLTMALVVVSLSVLVALIPPFALFSYLAMRGTVQRVKMLAVATSALRAGNYHVRVSVIGQDEVAQLQSDFNAMATDLQRTLHELQEQRDNVAKLLDERRQLIANVSHELRTPVATLRGYLETMLIHWDDISRPDIHQDLRVMEDETLRLHGLVEDLFTLSRAEVGKLEIHCVPTDVGEIVRRLVDTSASLAWRSSKIELVADIPDCLPPVLVDAKRLEQILHNLLHNGVRHTAPGGIVAIMVTAENAGVSLQVKDTGEGIAGDDLPYIWKRFFQSKSSRIGGGTGLGLALVKEWTEAMGGSVAVESVLGQGSCFTVRFPTSTLLPIPPVDATFTASA